MEENIYKEALKILVENINICILSVTHYLEEPTINKYAITYDDENGKECRKYISKEEWEILNKAFKIFD